MRRPLGNRLLLPTSLALLLIVASPLAGLSGASPPQGSPAVTLPREAAPEGLPLPYLGDPDAADAPFGSTPGVDGRIAPGEYAGAHKLTFPTYGGDMEVYLRQDGGSLYLAFDSPDTTPYPYSSGGGTGPAFQVFLDTNNDDASAPQPDDYRLTVLKNGSMIENVGNGSGWSNVGITNWTAAVYTATWGWQAEFAIRFAKLGIAPPTTNVVGLGLAEVWTPSWPHDWYWPAGAFYLNPSTWGDLASSSEWFSFYWKPGPWEDYAPSGMPDFAQMQVAPTFCGPFAAANSLWWFDSKFENRPVGPLPGGPPSTIPISDSYTLVQPYGTWDDHDPQNVVPLAVDLGMYFNTDGNPMGPGTYIYDMYDGIQRYLRDHGLWDDYIVTLVDKPEFDWIAEQVMRSEDVILLLGFWQEDPPGYWHRIGGHYVTVAGVDPLFQLIAFSDPAQDAAELFPLLPPSRVLSGTLIVHYPPHPGPDPTVHNDAGNVSHDVYPVAPGSPSPGGSWWLPTYEASPDLLLMPGMNPNPRWEEPPYPWNGGPVHTEIEYALAVSPFTWKPSGRWVQDADTPLYQRHFVPFQDFAPSGMPDFDQKQDNWRNLMTGKWSFCGPTAAANSLWWFDSKFELGGLVPPAISDTYPLVWAYGPWDDHHPWNVDFLGTPWPPPGWPAPPPMQPGQGELVEDLALYFLTDQPLPIGSGTVVTDVYLGLQQYLLDHNLRQGYVITQVASPEFWWVAEEVEQSEDVILLLGFYLPVGPSYERLGGHYVTIPGVDKEGGLVGFSDPYWDRMELALPPNEFSGLPLWTGRVGSDGDPPLGPSGLLPAYTHTITHTGAYTIHNDAANVSHDVYTVMPTDSPGGVWGPSSYVTMTDQIPDFLGMNGPGFDPGHGWPVQTEVEWAVSVSPVADVGIAKTVTPTLLGHGDWITFTITFTNVGSLPARNVIVRDPLPAQVTHTTWSAWVSGGGSVSSRTGTHYVWDVPDLGWLGWGIITVTGQISAADLSLVVTNTAAIETASVEQYQLPPLPNTSSVTFTVRNPDIGLTPASLEVTLTQGATATRPMTVSNSGEAVLNWNMAEFPAVTWLSETPSSGSTPAHQSTAVTAGFSAVGVPAGVHTTVLRTASNDPDTPSIDVPITLTVILYGVELKPDKDSATGYPGDTVTYTLRVTNAGTVTDSYNIVGNVAGQPWTTNWPGSVGPLAAGEGAQLEVTVHIPAGASNGQWSRATITATSAGDGSKWDTSVLTTTATTVTTIYGVEVWPESARQEGNPGDTLTFTLRVTNTGTVPDRIDLTHVGPATWTVGYSSSSLDLGAGQGADLYVYIGIPLGAHLGSTGTITLTATSHGDPARYDWAVLNTYLPLKHIYLPLVVKSASS